MGMEPLVVSYANPAPSSSDSVAMWSSLIGNAQAIGPKLNLILNPASGPGASPIDANYINTTENPPAYPQFGSAPLVEVRSGGADVFGYVATGFGPPGNADLNLPGRSLASVLADIDVYFESDYYRWAGVQVTGIFLDEMSGNVENIPHYQTIYDYVKQKSTTAYVVANPGINVAESYLNDLAGPTADTLVIFENTAAEYTTWSPAPWVMSGKYPPSRFAHIVYGVATADEMQTYVELANRRNADMAYISTDNAYTSLPNYWQDELTSLAAHVRCDLTEDGSCTTADIDALQSLGDLTVGVSANGHETFDFNGDTVVDLADRDAWLLFAADHKELAAPYELGDANLDGEVNDADFVTWNSHKFELSTLWSHGNFNGNLVVDVSDFDLWNEHRSSDAVAISVPEMKPATAVLDWLALTICLSNSLRLQRFATNGYLRITSVPGGLL